MHEHAFETWSSLLAASQRRPSYVAAFVLLFRLEKFCEHALGSRKCLLSRSERHPCNLGAHPSYVAITCCLRTGFLVSINVDSRRERRQQFLADFRPFASHAGHGPSAC